MEIHTIFNNIKEMLITRGDNIDEFVEHFADIDNDEFYNDKNIIELHTSDTTIIFALTKKLKNQIITELKEFAKNDDVSSFIEKYNNKNNVILIFNNDTISTPISQQLNIYDKMFQKKGGILQYFHMRNVMFNPTKHNLVPKHVKLNSEETNELMEKNLIKGKSQLPYILHTDTIAKWIGLKQGEVVKIERYNENSGLYYYYRVCV